MRESPGVLRWIARYARISPAAGAHLAVRCTGFTRFNRLERALPRSGRILDLGCGHGLFALLAASRASEREVLGIDLLEERVEVARRVAARHGVGNVRFERRSVLDLPAGPFDAVVVADVLMYLTRDSQRLVLESCASRLALGGALVVKEQVLSPEWKARMVVMQERFAHGARVRLGLCPGWGNVATGTVHLWESEDLVSLLRSFGLEVQEERLDRFSYLSHHLFVSKRVSSPRCPSSTTEPSPPGPMPPSRTGCARATSTSSSGRKAWSDPGQPSAAPSRGTTSTR